MSEYIIHLSIKTKMPCERGVPRTISAFHLWSPCGRGHIKLPPKSSQLFMSDDVPPTPRKCSTCSGLILELPDSIYSSIWRCASISLWNSLVDTDFKPCDLRYFRKANDGYSSVQRFTF